MTDKDEPLRENEVGVYGQLASRPNPNGLVILPVPAVEDMLPFLEKNAGHELTAEEIEAQRQKAPSLVVSKEVAEKILAGRTSRRQ